MAVQKNVLKEETYKKPSTVLKKPPAWGQVGGGAIKQDPFRERLERLNQLGTPTGMGNTSAVPNMNTEYSTPANISQLKKPVTQPAWMTTLTNAIASVNGGGNSWLTPPSLAGVNRTPGTQLSGPAPIRGTLRKPGQRTTNDGDAEVWVMPDGSTVSANYPATTPSQSHPPGAYPVILPLIQQLLAGTGSGGTTSGYGGFGTSYGGNWGGGGGGGGGGSYPDWMRNFLRLNNWNI